VTVSERRIGTVHVTSGEVAIVDPAVLAAEIGIETVTVTAALKNLMASESAYSAWTEFGEGLFGVFTTEIPLVDADPALLATWAPQYPGADLVSIDWSIRFGAALSEHNRQRPDWNV
jgi:hypothetical protein